MSLSHTHFCHVHILSLFFHNIEFTNIFTASFHSLSLNPWLKPSPSTNLYQVCIYKIECALLEFYSLDLTKSKTSKFNLTRLFLTNYNTQKLMSIKNVDTDAAKQDRI